MFVAGSVHFDWGTPSRVNWAGMICISPIAPAGETAFGLPLDSTAMMAAINPAGTL